LTADKNCPFNSNLIERTKIIHNIRLAWGSLTGHSKEATFVPCPKPLCCYRLSRWLHTCGAKTDHRLIWWWLIQFLTFGIHAQIVHQFPSLVTVRTDNPFKPIYFPAVQFLKTCREYHTLPFRITNAQSNLRVLCHFAYLRRTLLAKPKNY
jgi:hypothetical protein